MISRADQAARPTCLQIPWWLAPRFVGILSVPITLGLINLDLHKRDAAALVKRRAGEEAGHFTSALGYVPCIVVPARQCLQADHSVLAQSQYSIHHSISS